MLTPDKRCGLLHGSTVILLLHFSLSCKDKPRSRLGGQLRHPICSVSGLCNAAGGRDRTPSPRSGGTTLSEGNFLRGMPVASHS